MLDCCRARWQIESTFASVQVTPDILAALSTFGVGGLVSYLVMTWKRHDDQAWAEERKSSRQEIKDLAVQNMAVQERMLEAVIANTAAMHTLSKTVEALSSLELVRERLDRIERAVSAEDEPTTRAN